ncbi:MAG: cation-transporting P-type ATPase [Methyloprofundus sp.]|nr:cation-transporting P-type ATPase [Methyloprofundus sp.]
MSKSLNKHWHHLPEAEVTDLLDVNPDTGLDSLEIEERRDTYGANTLTIKKGKGPVLRFLLQFHQALIYILLLAIGIKASLGGWVDAGVILGVVVLNAIIGFVQESKALTALSALSHALTTEAVVLRSGEKQRINARDLVPGDIVLLQSGDKVSGDMRLLHSRELQVDESALTGESIPVSKAVSEQAHDTLLADRANMLYSSTLVTYGTGRGVVIATGDDTEIGRISKLITSAEILETPLTRKITKFSHILLFVILGLALLTFAVGLWHGDSWENLFMASVALSVAMIPEGLPAVMTITLAIGVSRMAKRNAIIRHLPAVETLGSTTVICSDKTGTLTRNEMTVQQLWAGNETFQASGIGYAPEGSISIEQSGEAIDVKVKPALLELLQAGLLCNDSILKQSAQGWVIEGDPTEGALLVSAAKAGLEVESLSTQMPRQDAIPFESQHQYMATLHSDTASGTAIIYLKGSVESLLERCNRLMATNSDFDQTLVISQAEAMAQQGLRVLAFAKLIVPNEEQQINHDTVANGLEFIGLQGMIDPPREEAIRAIAACRSAGIRVKMITGDHPATAVAIAHKMGLIASTSKEDSMPALNGRDLEALFDADLIKAASTTTVFARVSPEQKLRLVEALQAQGEVVAMTGDGVNDAPAVRKADIGVAMGITGTEVAKEAADMVLTDDNFATIEAAVEEGRGVLDNLIKFLSFILATNFGEGLVIIAAVLMSEILPVLPVHALWINMTAAIFLGLTLAFEPGEPGIMAKPPRPPAMPILKGELIFRIFLVGSMLLAGAFGLFEYALHQGASIEQARTIAVNVFAVGESFYLLNCRSLRLSMFRLGLFSNLWVWIGILCMAAAQWAFTYLPVMNKLFHTAPISLNDWIPIFTVGLIIHLVIAFDKRIRLWLDQRGDKKPA